MCGRVACAIDPRSLCCKSIPHSTRGAIAPVLYTPINKGAKGSDPSGYDCNIAPTSHIPVICDLKKLLCSGFDIPLNEVDSNAKLSERLIAVPMYWNLIPSYYRGDLKQFRLSTNNCRSETILEKHMYASLVKSGNRCLVVCDGYYEWKSISPKEKQPFMIHLSQLVNWWDSDSHGADKHSPLLMAGVFDVNKMVTKPVPFASVSIVTVDSFGTSTQFIHDRMPAVFQTVEDALSWIDPETSVEKVVHLLKPVPDLSFHRVSKRVNRVREHDLELVKPEPEKKIKGFMDSWLIKSGSKSSKRSSTETDDSIDRKFFKIEKSE